MHSSRICAAIPWLGISWIERKNGAAIAGKVFLFAQASQAQERVSFSTQDGSLVFGDLYGKKGDRGVVLAHGGRLTKESWEKQAQTLAATRFWSLAIEFRGEGQSRGGIEGRLVDEGRYLDILSAAHYCIGTKSISVIGASMGGDYAAEAAQAEPEEIDNLVLLASGRTLLSRR